MSGIAEFTPSTRPRFVSSVTPVSQALNAASLERLPKNVITQSKIIVRVTPMRAAWAASGESASEIPWIAANPMIETPHRAAPATTKTLRRRTRSDHAPTNSVVSVAVSAEAETMRATSCSDAPKESWTNRLRKLFSTAQATCPTKARSTMTSQVVRDIVGLVSRNAVGPVLSAMATSPLSASPDMPPGAVENYSDVLGRVEAPFWRISSQQRT